MKDKRQGNDLKVAWSIFMQDGEPFRLDGKDVSLYLKNMFGRKELNDFITTGNIIQWTFYGKDQKNSGKYSLELVINEGEKGMITTDKCDFVNLVSCSCKLQGGEDAPNVETESIELTSTLEYVSGGGSYDDTALWEELENKVDKVEGLGLSEENYTTEEKEKLANLENYDDSGIKEELANKAEKSEIPTKMSQLEQDIEIGSGYDDTELREAIDDLDNRLASRAEEIVTLQENKADKSEIAELSAEVSEKQDTITDLETIRSGAAKGATALQSVPDEYATKQYVDNAISEIPQGGGGGASNEWKCVADRRMVEGEKKVIFTTYADGTPLKATELMVQLLNDTKPAQSITGYVGIKSTNNQNEAIFGPLNYENSNLSEGEQRLQQLRICASPFFTIAELAPDVKCTVAIPTTAYYQGGNLKTFQIYEDIVYVRINTNTALTSAAPYLKVYAR